MREPPDAPVDPEQPEDGSSERSDPPEKEDMDVAAREIEPSESESVDPAAEPGRSLEAPRPDAEVPLSEDDPYSAQFDPRSDPVVMDDEPPTTVEAAQPATACRPDDAPSEGVLSRGPIDIPPPSEIPAPISTPTGPTPPVGPGPSPDWWPLTRTALSSAEVLTAGLLLIVIYGAVLAARGSQAFVTDWWRLALLILTFAVVRAVVRAQTVQPVRPPGVSAPAPTGQTIAVIIGASATAITALFQGGNVALQYLLSAENERAKIGIEVARGEHIQNMEKQKHALEREAADRKHSMDGDDRAKASERELAGRALSYLELALANESYSHRLTILGFLESVNSGQPDAKSTDYYQSMQKWAKLERIRLQAERDRLLEILDDILGDCEADKNRCQGAQGKSRRDSILGIVRQVGPESLKANGRGKRATALGVPIAFVGENDLLIRAAADRAPMNSRIAGSVDADGDGMSARPGESE